MSGHPEKYSSLVQGYVFFGSKNPNNMYCYFETKICGTHLDRMSRPKGTPDACSYIDRFMNRKEATCSVHGQKIRFSKSVVF